MSKCSECGFFTTSKHLLAIGKFPEMGKEARKEPGTVDMPACFVLQADLHDEVQRAFAPKGAELDELQKANPHDHTIGIGEYGKTQKTVLTKNRPECDGVATAWIQGFTPKEHREMLDRERMLKLEYREKVTNWVFRIVEIVIVVSGVLLTVWITLQAAKIEADATRDAADRQIQFQERLLSTPTPIAPQSQP